MDKVQRGLLVDRPRVRSQVLVLPPGFGGLYPVARLKEEWTCVPRRLEVQGKTTLAVARSRRGPVLVGGK